MSHKINLKKRQPIPLQAEIVFFSFLVLGIVHSGIAEQSSRFVK